MTATDPRPTPIAPRLIAMTPVEEIQPGDIICASDRVTATRQTAKRVYFTVVDARTGEPREGYHQQKGTNISRWDLGTSEPGRDV